MKCRSCRRALTRYLDDRLDADARAAVDAHMAACDPCAAERDAIAGTRAALAAIGPARVPSDLANRAVALATTPPGEPAPGLLGAFVRVGVPAAGIAVALAIALMSIPPADEPANAAPTPAPAAMDIVDAAAGYTWMFVTGARLWPGDEG